MINTKNLFNKKFKEVIFSETYIQKLIKKAQYGDKEALKQIFEIYYDFVFFFIKSRIQSYHDAQDLASDVFMALFENIKMYKGTASFKNYLFGIIKNKLKDYLKNKKLAHNTLLFSDLPFELNDTLTNIPQRSKNKQIRLRKAINYIMNIINPRYATILNLIYNHAYSRLEIARKLNLSLNNLKVLEHRAIRKAIFIWSNLDRNVKAKLLSK